MNEPMTPERIAAAEERCAKATPGPWIVEPINDGETYQVTTAEDSGFSVICETPWVDEPGDSGFIASARTDLPDLLECRRVFVDAVTRKLADCRASGGCSDAALMPGEFCSDECVALDAALRKAGAL